MTRDVTTTTTPASNVAKCSAIVLLTATLSACGTLDRLTPWNFADTASEASGQESAVDGADYSLISRNLVNAFAQHPSLSPRQARIQVANPEDGFESQVHKDMQGLGFRLEVAEGSTDEDLVRTIVDSGGDALENEAALYALSIGDITAERRFETVNGVTVPVGKLTIRGADELPIALNDEELFGDVPAEISRVAFEPPTAATPASLEQVFRPSDQAPSGGDVDQIRAGLVKRNIFDTLTSNFSELFVEFENVEQNILIFPNDSLRLGDANKAIIDEYAAKMNPETDILSVIGCSHGQTEISNGNSLLALGRANRVKEALLFAGVDHEKVMEEGCWAPTTFDGEMPDRGVVLTLKRKSDS